MPEIGIGLPDKPTVIVRGQHNRNRLLVPHHHLRPGTRRRLSQVVEALLGLCCLPLPMSPSTQNYGHSGHFLLQI